MAHLALAISLLALSFTAIAHRLPPTCAQIVGASPVNFVADGKKLLSQIRMYDLPDEAAPPPRPEQAQTEVPDAEPSFDTMEDA